MEYTFKCNKCHKEIVEPQENIFKFKITKLKQWFSGDFSEAERYICESCIKEFRKYLESYFLPVNPEVFLKEKQRNDFNFTLLRKSK